MIVCDGGYKVFYLKMKIYAMTIREVGGGKCFCGRENAASEIDKRRVEIEEKENDRKSTVMVLV